VDKEYYRTIDLAWAVVGAHQDRYHRSPQGIQAHEFCGFNSLYALEAWFDGWLDKLFAAGYVVAEYDGVGVRTFGNGQVTFNKNLSNRLTTTTV
jgi:ribosome modulation factor